MNNPGESVVNGFLFASYFDLACVGLGLVGDCWMVICSIADGWKGNASSLRIWSVEADESFFSAWSLGGTAGSPAIAKSWLELAHAELALSLGGNGSPGAQIRTIAVGGSEGASAAWFGCLGITGVDESSTQLSGAHILLLACRQHALSGLFAGMPACHGQASVRSAQNFLAAAGCLAFA